MSRRKRFVVAVDVGTGSARAGVFDLKGTCHAHQAVSIRIWRPEADFVEQSSADIWRGCARAVKGALRESGVVADQVDGVSFDATCSLVCLDRVGRPVTASPTGRSEQNVIVWMDHRAVDQADRINQTGHKVLKYVGGGVSPEMQTPKLLWLKEHCPRTWLSAGYFFDLADFLTWRATGSAVRSLCTTVCKWTYQGHAGSKRPDAASVGRWDDAFFQQIGLGNLVDEGFERIGRTVRPMGEPIGDGLTAKAARDLGLRAGTPVGVGIIDAHAGGLGLIGAPLDGEGLTERNAPHRLALIGGTSSCHMAVSAKARFIRGVWGPYYSAMVPGMWLTEGGQSATGALIDHCVETSQHAAALHRQARQGGKTVYDLLNERLTALADGADMARLTARLHVLGYHHGNRSPRADPLARGMVSGLTLSDTVDDLALRYLATIQAIAYGTRHILETINAKGFAIRDVLACGGDTKNPVFLAQHADICGCRIHLPREPEAVLLGTAVLAAVAAGAYPDIPSAMARMTRVERTIEPAQGDTRAYHDRKFEVFRRLYADQCQYDKMMTADA